MTPARQLPEALQILQTSFAQFVWSCTIATCHDIPDKTSLKIHTGQGESAPAGTLLRDGALLAAWLDERSTAEERRNAQPSIASS